MVWCYIQQKQHVSFEELLYYLPNLWFHSQVFYVQFLVIVIRCSDIKSWDMCDVLYSACLERLV